MNTHVIKRINITLPEETIQRIDKIVNPSQAAGKTLRKRVVYNKTRNKLKRKSKKSRNKL